MTVAEAESASRQGSGRPSRRIQGRCLWNFTKKTYTWKGVLKQHTLTAYYTKEKEPHLHHFETEGSKYDWRIPRTQASRRGEQEGVRRSRNQRRRRKNRRQNGNCAAGQGPKPIRRPVSPRQATSRATPKTEPSDKPPAPKPARRATPATKDQPPAPSDKESTRQASGRSAGRQAAEVTNGIGQPAGRPSRP